MKKASVFKSKDGKLFEDRNLCIQHECIQDTKILLNKFFDEKEKNEKEFEESTTPSDDMIDDLARYILKNNKKVIRIFNHFYKRTPIKQTVAK